MTEEARILEIPDYGRTLPRVNSSLLAIRAVIGLRPLRNGIYPVNIIAVWGKFLRAQPAPIMRQQFRAEAVYDVPSASAPAPLRQRPGPFRAGFEADQADVVSRQLYLGGNLRVRRDDSAQVHHQTHGLRAYLEPDSKNNTGVIFTAHRIVPAAYEQRNGFEVGSHDEARLVLDAFARAVLPVQADADWLVTQLLPPPPTHRQPA